MKKHYYYYENSLREDLNNVRKIKAINKRETVIFTAASLLGMAAYGLMKSKGFGDLESNYPLMGLYLASYLESLQHQHKLFVSKKKVDELASMVDETEPDKVVDLLMDADVDVTKGISICDGIEKTTRIKEEYVKDGEVIFTQEEETVEEYDELKSSKVGVYSYPESLSKTLK